MDDNMCLTLMNIGTMAVASTAIAVACKVTKSALPLLAFMLVPRWTLNISNEKEEEK